MSTLGIIISTTRRDRFGDRPALWLRDLVQRRSDIETRMLDLRDFGLPFFDETVSPLRAAPENQAARRWADALNPLDAFVIITAEYNHGPPAVLKNALDSVYQPLNRKPVGFVGYGGVGGARAVEQLRLICCELQMAPTRFAVHIGQPEFLALAQQGASFDDYPHLATAADAMLNDLQWWSDALGRARGSSVS